MSAKARFSWMRGTDRRAIGKRWPAVDRPADRSYVIIYNMTAGTGAVKQKVIAYYMVNRRSPTAGGRQRYHHGDLRRDLLRVAREEIIRHGAQSVSLSSLARLAGVSQPAPYRHFADRDALLEAVAAQGFEQFAAKLAEATTGRDCTEALKATALAYVTFGELNVELYRLMFASRLTPQARSGSELDEAAGKAFELLRLAMSRSWMRPVAQDQAYLVWAQLHGLVMLKADGFIKRALAAYVEIPGLLGPASPRVGLQAWQVDNPR